MERTMQHGALVLRLALGTMFIAHALLKCYVFTLPGALTPIFRARKLPAVIQALS
jgi:putative oxidoreductase